MTTINLDGVVGWDIDASEFAQLLDSTSGDITFELNSGGGYVTDGISILNKIRSYNKGKTTANISYAASMMTQIALACDEVNAYDNAIFMIHNVQGIVVGDHNDMKEAAELQERMSNMLAQLYVKKTSKSEEEIKEMMDADTYLFGKEIQDMNFVDNIIDTDNKKDKETASVESKAMLEKVEKAMKQEKLSLSDMKNNFKQCAGNCTAAAMPSENEKLVNSKEGAIMTEQEIQDMQNANKVMVANRVTLLARIETLEANEKALATDLDTKKEAISALEANIESKISEAKEADKVEHDKQMLDAKTQAEARINEAFTTGVASAETVMSMINAESDEKASEIALAAKPDTKALEQGGSLDNKESDLLAYAKRNKGSMR